MKKIISFLILTFFLTNLLKSQPVFDNNSDITIRVEQAAYESKKFRELTNGDSLPRMVMPIKDHDTLRYRNGKIFRICNAKFQRLNGVYEMYYPTGQLYEKRMFKDGFLVDTSEIYRENGILLKKICVQKKYIYETHYYNNGIPKKICKDENINKNVKIFYDTKFNKQDRLIIKYFDTNGTEITKEEFIKLDLETK